MTQSGSYIEEDKIINMSPIFLLAKHTRCWQLTVTPTTTTRMKPQRVGSRGAGKGWEWHQEMKLLMIWMMGQSAPSASLQVTQSWRKRLICQKLMLPSRGTSAGWSSRPTGTSREVQQEEKWDPSNPPSSPSLSVAGLTRKPPGSPCMWPWTPGTCSLCWRDTWGLSSSITGAHMEKQQGRIAWVFPQRPGSKPPASRHLPRQQISSQVGSSVCCRRESPSTAGGCFLLVLSHSSGLASSDTWCPAPRPLPRHWTYSAGADPQLEKELPSCCLKPPASSLRVKSNRITVTGASICHPDEHEVWLLQESRLLFLQWLGPVRTLPTCFSSPLMLCYVPPSSHSSLTWWQTSSTSTRLL